MSFFNNGMEIFVVGAGIRTGNLQIPSKALKQGCWGGRNQ